MPVDDLVIDIFYSQREFMPVVDVQILIRNMGEMRLLQGMEILQRRLCAA